MTRRWIKVQKYLKMMIGRFNNLLNKREIWLFNENKIVFYIYLRTHKIGEWEFINLKEESKIIHNSLKVLIFYILIGIRRR